jgi:mannosylglycerate hydrolase
VLRIDGMAEGDNTAGHKARRTVAVVAHTHWDREWYQPFEAVRLRLVEVLDDVLARLEADPSIPHFMVDGQMAAVDDYLELRPEAEPRLRRLAAAGRLAVGPWYVLPDEFLVSGETLVRNLQLGLDRAAAFGGAMEVGYLPDMFGHVAQMPQLLRQAGLDHAVVWRGVPAAVNRTAFWWRAPDGSGVRAEYLPVGYSNGAAVPDDAKALVERIRLHEAGLGALLAPDAPLLWMNGDDHTALQPHLGRVVAEAGGLTDDHTLEITSLARYLAASSVKGLPSWTGELRSGARANLLMGVASNRVDVKQAAARAERALERLAEPLAALFGDDPGPWTAAALRRAWTGVVRNAAHDSVCACSADDVVAAVVVRYAEATHLADAVTARALADLGSSMAVAGPVVVNPSAHARRGLVELLLPGTGDVEGGQVVAARPGSATERVVTGGLLGILLAQAANEEEAWGGAIVGVDVSDDESGLDVVLRTGPRPTPTTADPSLASTLADLAARAAAHRRDPVHVRVEHEPYRRVLVRADDVPGFGWTAWSPTDPPSEVAPVSAARDETADGCSLANGLVTVAVDPADGTFSIDARGTAVRGLDLLVDDADAGDTYNYSPPEGDIAVDAPTSVTVAIEEHGPLRAALRVVRTFEWPERLAGGRERVGQRAVEVSTRLELRAGEALVRITTTLDNPCRDHRLRAWFPLPTPATSTRAECAFGTVERGLTAEGGVTERGLPTFPSRRFVTAGGLTLVHEGLLEYELVDDGQALALTLLRCVGILSGTNLAYRPLPAGPPLPVAGAQMPGRHVLRYAVAVGDHDPYAVVDDAFLPLLVASGSGEGPRPASGSALTITGAQVSAVRRVGGGRLEVRVFNPGDEEATVDLGGRTGWLVDLRDRPVEPVTGSFRLRPWGIATAHLDLGGAS